MIASKHIKVIVNGGSLNPSGLARKCQKEVTRRGLNLKVAFVEGDDLLPQITTQLARGELPEHLDSKNKSVSLQAHAEDLRDVKGKPVVSANAYLGARAIVRGLEMGADVIVCGRVADASPVVSHSVGTIFLYRLCGRLDSVVESGVEALHTCPPWGAA